MHQSLGATYGPLPLRLAIPVLVLGAVVAAFVVYDMYRTYGRSIGRHEDG